MFRTSAIVARLLPRLAYQLVPAALVTTVGVLLLSNLAKAPSAAPDTAAVETPINAEAVFRIAPHEIQADAQDQDVRRAKAAAFHTAVKLPPRKPASEPAPPHRAASVPPPLQIVQIPEQPQPAIATPDSDGSVMGKLRSATAAAQRLPHWAADSVTGWFAAASPPRPPSDVPTPPANFQAAM